MRKQTSAGLIQLGIVALVLWGLSRIVSPYWVGLMTEALIWALFALSLDILLGHTGLPSLGHSAFYGMGAYASAIWFLRVTNDFWSSLVVGVSAASALAVIYGMLALRTVGIYFLMITLALGQVLWGIAYSLRQLTNGDDGLRGITRENLAFLGLRLGETGDYFLFVLGAFLLTAGAVFVIIQSPFGYALRGIRESSERMEALGYNVWLCRLFAFVIAGALAGFAGVLLVFNKNYVSPEALGVNVSAEVLLMVILGGAGTLLGPVIGAFMIVMLSYVVSGLTDRWNMVLGVIYILVVVTASGGLTNLIARRKLAKEDEL